MKKNKYTESGDLDFSYSSTPIIYTKEEFEKELKKQRKKDFEKKLNNINFIN